MHTSYDDPIRVRVHESDWALLKIRAIREGNRRYQELLGDLVADLALSTDWQLRDNTSVNDWRSVWMQLPTGSKEHVDKLRSDRGGAPWSQIVNAALTKAGEAV